ncbi:MAG: AmmeMemoRadiSam system protein B [Patescibacteria group bacterium]|nr:AmmeMemoRadiSam system protein B [Patescibacteria group bacterium]
MSDFIRRFPEVLVNSRIIEIEHSITVPVIYLREYFPNARIIPLIVSANFRKPDIDKYAKCFANIFPYDTVYIAAVDFSHGTSFEEGMTKNEESIKIISEFNYQKLYGLKDDHLDSPSAIGLLLKTMQSLNSTNWETCLVLTAHF